MNCSVRGTRTMVQHKGFPHGFKGSIKTQQENKERRRGEGRRKVKVFSKYKNTEKFMKEKIINVTT